MSVSDEALIAASQAIREALADLPLGTSRARAREALDLLLEALGLGHPLEGIAP